MGEYYNGAYIFDVEIKKKTGKKISDESKSERIDLTFKEKNKISEDREGFRGIGYLADCLEKGRIELDEIDANKLATVVKNLGYLYGSKDKRYTNNYVESIVRYVCVNYKNCANPGEYFANCYDEGMKARVDYNTKEERKSASMVTQALNNEMIAQEAARRYSTATNRLTGEELNQANKVGELNPEGKKIEI